jgi:hypothetical protein
MLGLGSKGPLCVCPAKFSPHLALPALPMLELPQLPNLNLLLNLAPAMAGAGLSAANLKLLLGLKIPALPIPALQLGAMDAMLPALMLIKKSLGIDITAPGASAQLALSLHGLAKLPLPPIPAIPLPLLELHGLVVSLQSIKMMTGFNLMTPSLPKLQLAINAALALPPLPIDPMPVVHFSTLIRLCSGLGISITTPGAFLKLALACRAVASLSLPALPNLSSLLNLLNLLQITANLQSFFKLNLAIPGASLQLKLALAPLLELAQLKLGPPAAGWSMMPLMMPAISLGLPALPKLDFGPLLNLPALPNLGPLMAAISLTAALNLGMKPGCLICPMAA